MKRTATPLFGGDIGDGFGEVQAVAVKILGIVLFAVGMVLRFSFPLENFQMSTQRNSLNPRAGEVPSSPALSFHRYADLRVLDQRETTTRVSNAKSLRL